MVFPKEGNVYIRQQEGEEAHCVPVFRDGSLPETDAKYFHKLQIIEPEKVGAAYTGRVIKGIDASTEKIAVSRGDDLTQTAGSVKCYSHPDYTLASPLRDEYIIQMQTTPASPLVVPNTPSVYHGQRFNMVTDANGNQQIDLTTPNPTGRFMVVYSTDAFQRILRGNVNVQAVRVRIPTEYQLF